MPRKLSSSREDVLRSLIAPIVEIGVEVATNDYGINTSDIARLLAVQSERGASFRGVCCSLLTSRHVGVDAKSVVRKAVVKKRGVDGPHRCQTSFSFHIQPTTVFKALTLSRAEL